VLLMSYPRLFKIAMASEKLFIYVELDRREEKWVATDAQGGLHINCLVLCTFIMSYTTMREE
jgi:hypothetical protein